MPNGEGKESWVCPQHQACEAQIDHLKEQQAATWKRIEDNQRELKQDIDKLENMVQETQIKSAKYAEAFAAIQNNMSAMSASMQTNFNNLSVRIDAIANKREAEKASAMDWAKLAIGTIVAAIFLYWLKTGT